MKSQSPAGKTGSSRFSLRGFYFLSKTCFYIMLYQGAAVGCGAMVLRTLLGPKPARARGQNTSQILPRYQKSKQFAKQYDGCRESLQHGKRPFFSPIFFGQEAKKMGPPEAGPGNGSAGVGSFHPPENALVVADAHIGHKTAMRNDGLWPMWASATTVYLMLHCTCRDGTLLSAYLLARKTDCHTSARTGSQ